MRDEIGKSGQIDQCHAALAERRLFRLVRNNYKGNARQGQRLSDLRMKAAEDHGERNSRRKEQAGRGRFPHLVTGKNRDLRGEISGTEQRGRHASDELRHGVVVGDLRGDQCHMPLPARLFCVQHLRADPGVRPHKAFGGETPDCRAHDDRTDSG